MAKNLSVKAHAVKSGTARKNAFIILALTTACAFIGGCVWFFSTQDADRLRNLVVHYLTLVRDNPWSYPLICAVYVFSGFILFPAAVLNLATAIVFGPVYGFVCGISGYVLNAVVFFTLGRMGRERGLKNYLRGAVIRNLDEKLSRAGVIGVTVLRMVPTLPFSIFNTIAGVTSLRFIDFIAGTFLVFWPGGVARAVLGDSILKVFLDPSLGTTLYVVAAFALWGLVVLAIHLALRKYRGRYAV